MPSFFFSLLLAILCSLLPSQHAHAIPLEYSSSPEKEAVITINDYCDFLNTAPAGQDPGYDLSATSQLFVFGEPGNYHYEVARATDLEEPVTLLSWKEAAEYCDFKNNSLPFPFFFLSCHDNAATVDPFLKSNLLLFSLRNVEANPYEMTSPGEAMLTEHLLNEVIEEFIVGIVGIEAASRLRRTPNEQRTRIPTAPLPSLTTMEGGYLFPKPGGGIYGDRRYTEHALERMAPKIPEIIELLTMRAFKRAKTQGLRVNEALLATWREQSPEIQEWWRKNCPQPREILPAEVEAEIAKPHSTGLKVITGEDGTVITVMRQGKLPFAASLPSLTTMAGGYLFPKPDGGIYGGRRYTEHALERMAPKTPEMLELLTMRAFKRAKAQGLEGNEALLKAEAQGLEGNEALLATWREQSPEIQEWWRKNRPQPQEILPAEVEAEIATPHSTDLSVITSVDGTVITVMRQGKLLSAATLPYLTIMEGGYLFPEPGGGIYFGRRYTKQALERMAPKTPKIIDLLWMRAFRKAEAQGREVSEASEWWRKHRPQPQEILPAEVEAEIATPHSTGLKVITDKEGTVITVMRQGKLPLNKFLSNALMQRLVKRVTKQFEPDAAILKNRQKARPFPKVVTIRLQHESTRLVPFKKITLSSAISREAQAKEAERCNPLHYQQKSTIPFGTLFTRWIEPYLKEKLEAAATHMASLKNSERSYMEEILLNRDKNSGSRKSTLISKRLSLQTENQVQEPSGPLFIQPKPSLFPPYWGKSYLQALCSNLRKRVRRAKPPTIIPIKATTKASTIQQALLEAPLTTQKKHTSLREISQQKSNKKAKQEEKAKQQKERKAKAPQQKKQKEKKGRNNS